MSKLAKVWLAIALVLVALGLWATIGRGGGTPREGSVEPAVAVSEIPLRPFVKGSLAGIVAAGAGRPLAVVFWSTACIQCIVEMETWRDLGLEHPGVKIVLVSTDPIARPEPIRYVLRREGVGDLESWAFADPIPARVRSDVDPGWRGELPRIHLYDAAGRGQERIGVMPEAEVLAWLGID